MELIIWWGHLGHHYSVVLDWIRLSQDQFWSSLYLLGIYVPNFGYDRIPVGSKFRTLVSVNINPGCGCIQMSTSVSSSGCYLNSFYERFRLGFLSLHSYDIFWENIWCAEPLMFHILIIFTHPRSFILVLLLWSCPPFFSGILNIGTFGLLHYFNEFSAVFRRRILYGYCFIYHCLLALQFSTSAEKLVEFLTIISSYFLTASHIRKMWSI